MTAGRLIGLELHRLIDRKKLFCGCKFKKIDEKTSIKQYVRYPLITANVYEYNTSKDYCLHQVDQIPAKLNTSIFKKAVRCITNIPGVKVLEKVVYCRKVIIDNSVPSGYQITACVATGGFITLSTGTVVEVDKVLLEQDSCRNENGVFYVDRLGLPLIQVSTKPANLTTQQVKECLIELDYVLSRNHNLPCTSYCRRQDINVSVPGHPKTQIKGVSNISAIARIIEIQTDRQLKNLQQRTVDSSTRKVNEDGTTSFMRVTTGADRMQLETQIPPTRPVVLKLADYNFYETFAPAMKYAILKKIKNRAQMKSLYALHKRYNIRARDLSLYFHGHKLKPSEKMALFTKYLDGSISEVTFKTGGRLETLRTDELDRLRAQVRTKSDWNEYLRNYKKRMPRNYEVEPFKDSYQ